MADVKEKIDELTFDKLTFDEMTARMKALQGQYGEDMLATYLAKADVYSLQQDSGKEVEELLRQHEERIQTDQKMTEHLWSTAVYTALKDWNMGTDLLATAMEKGFYFNRNKLNDQVSKKLNNPDPSKDAWSLLREAESKFEARQEYARFMNGHSEALNADVVRYHPEKIDDIVAQCDRIVKDARDKEFLHNKVPVFTELMQDKHLSDKVRVKIASKMLDDKKNAENWTLVGAALDMVNGMDKPQGKDFDKLIKQLKKSVIAYAEDVKSTKQKELDLNQNNNELKEKLVRAAEAEAAHIGAVSGQRWVEVLRDDYDALAKCDKNKDKPFLSKEKAEELVAKVLKGEEVFVPEVKQSLWDRLSGSSDQRREHRNRAIRDFNSRLQGVLKLPADTKKAKRNYRKEVDRALRNHDHSNKVASRIFYDAEAKEMLLGLQGQIFADSTPQKCQEIVDQKLEVKEQSEARYRQLYPAGINIEHGAQSLTPDYSLGRLQFLRKNDLIAKMKQYDDKAAQRNKADRQEYKQKHKATDALEQRQEEANNKDMESRQKVVKETSQAVRAALAGKQKGRA